MEYIINTRPVIKSVDKMKFFSARNKLLDNKVLTVEEERIILDFYVNEVRKSLSRVLNIDIYNDPLTNRCDTAQLLMGSLLENVGITVYPKETEDVISPEVINHSFLVAIINHDAYLIDLTYRQFFIKENCDIERLKMNDDLIYDTPDPGFFASRPPLRETVNEILKSGYVLLDENTAKHYCDSFYFAKRGRGWYNDIKGSIYLKSLLSETHEYSINEDVLISRGF